MITLTASVCIEAPAARVWAHLARLEDIHLWSDAVLQARCDGPVTRGVGAERTCELVGHRTIHERWVAWDDGRSFTYEGFGIPLVKRASNRWSVLCWRPGRDNATSTDTHGYASHIPSPKPCITIRSRG